MPSEKPPARRRATGGEADQLEHLVHPAAGQAVAVRHPQQVVAGPPAGVDRAASSSAPTSRSGVRSARYGRPPTSAVPASGASSPRIIRIVVDLPAPLGPTNPVTWPGGTVNDRPSTATVAPVALAQPADLDGWLSMVGDATEPAPAAVVTPRSGLRRPARGDARPARPPTGERTRRPG